MVALPTDRTLTDTKVEHLADHNEAHDGQNLNEAHRAAATPHSGHAPIASPTFTGVATAPVFVASGLSGAVAASRYVGATAAGAPVSGSFLKGDFVIDQAGKFWVCTVTGTPGTWAHEPGDTGDTGDPGPAVSVLHAAVAGTARPVGVVTPVLWVGSVTPSNAIDGDIWIDTA